MFHLKTSGLKGTSKGQQDCHLLFNLQQTQKGQVQQADSKAGWWHHAWWPYLYTQSRHLKGQDRKKEGEKTRFTTNQKKKTLQSGDVLHICDCSLTSNIPQGPHSLLTNVRMRRGDETNESWNGPSFYHSCSLIGCPGRNISQGPGCFKLNRRGLRHAQEAYKLGNQACTDDSVNGWMPLPRQQLPKKTQTWLHKPKRQNRGGNWIFHKFWASSPCSLGCLQLSFEAGAVNAINNLLHCPMLSLSQETWDYR